MIINFNLIEIMFDNILFDYVIHQPSVYLFLGNTHPSLSRFRKIVGRGDVVTTAAEELFAPAPVTLASVAEPFAVIGRTMCEVVFSSLVVTLCVVGMLELAAGCCCCCWTVMI